MVDAAKPAAAGTGAAKAAPAPVVAKPGPGHNSSGIAAERLKSFVERVERLEEEKKALASDIKEVYSEAKSSGFDVKIMRLLVRLRRRDDEDVDEEAALLDTYKRALGMKV